MHPIVVSGTSTPSGSQALADKKTPSPISRTSLAKVRELRKQTPVFEVLEEDDRKDFSICKMTYPTDPQQRRIYKTKKGKSVTLHQWAVYDYTRKIPRGKVTTYKSICDSLGQGSPRSVGSALRNNPFAPYVPCHRVVASNHFIGGFLGEWNGKTVLNLAVRNANPQVRKKAWMLAREGVGFTKDGMLIDVNKVLWR